VQRVVAHRNVNGAPPRRRGRHGGAVASIAIRASLGGVLCRRRTADTARVEPLRPRRTAAEGLRLNAQTPWRPAPLSACSPGVSPTFTRTEEWRRLPEADMTPVLVGNG